MQKKFWRAIVLAALIGAPLTFAGTRDASAGMSVGIKIGLPPAVVFQAPPSMAVIPGTYVYLAPDVQATVLFYEGRWYRPYEGRWYRANSYNGPWVHLASRNVPRALVKLPQHYRNAPREYRRISSSQMERNWRKWERDGHWTKDKDWRAGWKGREKGNAGHDDGRGHDRHERGNGGRG